ncbi:hypothetical protein FPV67DRAFT_421125 [Lyophyllum atratum]|nr:hypothetical protein FPV67DRAFT_421125 [Lyophyllum atratum]
MSTTYQLSCIPTPPFSPHPGIPSPPDTSFQSTLDVLDSLLEFYQQERVWVQRTRTALEEAFLQVDQSDHPDTLPSPPSESASTSSAGCSDKSYPTAGPPPASPKPLTSQWSRRKKGFKLRLDGLAPHNNRMLVSQRVRPIVSRKDFSQRKRILDMLDQMMEARMESCQGINRLVRNASRAEPYYP